MIELVKQNFEKNKKLYSNIEKELKINLGDNRPITHVGSTAIPNMYGKNIIDILIGALNFDELEEITASLINMGYFVSKSKVDIYRFFSSTEEETASGDIHIHLVILDTERYQEFIILKTYLLCNQLEAKNYSEFKKKIVKKNVKEREKYKMVKSEYVSNLILRAKINYSNQINKDILL